MAGPMWWRTDDLTRWGVSNSGGNLTGAMFDQNNWYLLSLIVAIQNNPPQAVSIDYFTVVGDQMTIHMTDHSLRGPFTMPVTVWHFTNPPSGAWLPTTLYFVLDIVTNNGAVYLRLIQGISGSVFDPNETDGSGHYLWGLLLSSPALQLPTGGSVGMALTKIDGVDFHTFWKYPVPIGGTTGQVLAKNSNSNLDMFWESLIGIPAGGATNYKLTKASGADGDTQWVPDGLGNLSDVVISGTVTGQFLHWSGSSWINYTLKYSDLYNAVDTTHSPTGSGSVTIDPSLGSVWKITPTADITALLAAAAPIGKFVTIIITTSGTVSFTITPSSGFKTAGPLVTGTVSGKTFVWFFVGDGSFLTEISRTAAY